MALAEIRGTIVLEDGSTGRFKITSKGYETDGNPRVIGYVAALSDGNAFCWAEEEERCTG